jgi:hypothetical protein
MREVYELDFKKSLHPSDELFSAIVDIRWNSARSLKALKWRINPWTKITGISGEFSKPGEIGSSRQNAVSQAIPQYWCG